MIADKIHATIQASGFDGKCDAGLNNLFNAWAVCTAQYCGLTVDEQEELRATIAKQTAGLVREMKLRRN